MKELLLKMKKPTKNQIELFNINAVSRSLRGAKLIAYKQTLVLTEEQKEVIIGTLLGASWIRASNCNFSLKFEQKYTQIDYLIHLYEVFKPFVGTGPKMRIITNSFHKDYGVSCWFRTYAHIAFKYYENRFYQIDAKRKRHKVVPKNIHQMLTPRALAYWFMDDGSYLQFKNEPLYILNTQGFTRSDQKRLVIALKQNFDLDVNISKDRQYYRLVVQNHDNQAFRKLIEPYVLSNFQYKLF